MAWGTRRAPRRLGVGAIAAVMPLGTFAQATRRASPNGFIEIWRKGDRLRAYANTGYETDGILEHDPALLGSQGHRDQSVSRLASAR